MMIRSMLSIVVGVLALVAGNAVLAQPEIKSATYTITQVKQYNLQVVRINGRSLTVDVEGFGRRRFQVPRDFTFEIDGESKTLNQILPGQRLRAYVTETQTGELLLVQDEASTDGVVGETVSDEVDAEEEAAPVESTAPDAAEPESVAPEAPATPEPPQDDMLANASFESPPAQLPATATNQGWMVILGVILLVAGLATGWVRRHRGEA